VVELPEAVKSFASRNSWGILQQQPLTRYFGTNNFGEVQKVEGAGWTMPSYKSRNGSDNRSSLIKQPYAIL
jgi:hypothetical protein